MVTASINPTTAAVAFVATSLALYIFNVGTKSMSRIPGPWYSKWTSAVRLYHWFFGSHGQYVDRLHKMYGPVVRISPNEADICDVEAYKQIYSVRETFVKSAWYRAFTGNVVTTIFNTADPSYHRRIRRLLSWPLSEASIVAWQSLVDTKSRLVVQRMKEEMGRKGAADIYMWWMFFANDVIGELTFGESFNMLEKTEKNDYSKDLESLGQAGTTYTTFIPFHDLINYLPLPLFQRSYRTNVNILRYAEQSLARYRRLVDEGSEKPTLFSRVYKAQEAEDITFEEIRNNSTAYISAGTDTTAVTMTYFVWAVLKNPHVMAELVAEVQAMPDDVTDADLKEARYLNWTIDETLRLYGAVQSGLPRMVPNGGATLAGHWFEGGTTVACQAYSMHRDPRVFAKPLKFNPNRWENPTKEMRDSLGTFGGGSRVCIGQHLAQLEMRSGLFRFFRAFPEAKLAGREDDMDLETYFVITPKGHRCLVGVPE